MGKGMKLVKASKKKRGSKTPAIVKKAKRSY